MTCKSMVDGVLQKLSVEGKQRFYEEMKKNLAKGLSQEAAISEAFKKLGIDPWKIDLKASIDILYEKQGGGKWQR